MRRRGVSRQAQAPTTSAISPQTTKSSSQPSPPHAHPQSRFSEKPKTDEAGAQRYIQLMEEAAASQQWNSAANLGKMALQIAPENAAVARRQKEYQDLADQTMAPQFEEQARNAEAHRDYPRAAMLFERAANGSRSATLYAKAATNLKRGEPSARKLVDLYRQATRFEPTNLNYKLELVEAYLQAGSIRSAATLLAQAQKIDKKHPKVRELQQKLK